MEENQKKGLCFAGLVVCLGAEICEGDERRKNRFSESSGH